MSLLTNSAIANVGEKIEELTKALEEHKEASKRQSKWVIRLTFVVAILTLVLILQGFNVL